MKKVFISQPMHGKTLEEIHEEREKLKKEARRIMPDEELEFIDSVIYEEPPEKRTALWYLGKSLQIMATADVVLFSKDWWRSRGCVIEHDCANNYDLEVWMAERK